LRAAGASDLHLQNLTVELPGATGYLQTSPEYAMKILLADYREDIYQICPAFRGGESGNRHLTEFQMLEWYRCGLSLVGLMDDLESLVNSVIADLAADFPLVLSAGRFRRVTYRELFEQSFGLNPHDAPRESLVQVASSVGLDHIGSDASVADCLDALFSTVIEPELAAPTLVFDYPAFQSALAEVGEGEQGDRVSRRFELFAGGLELANAYQELTDAEELRARFDENNRQRAQTDKPEVPADEELIEATSRMPACTGIALGMDRLAMVLLGEREISAVIP
jgi:lysyl-tRNA synthetase class 2